MEEEMKVIEVFQQMVNLFGDNIKIETVSDSRYGWTFSVNISGNVSEEKLHTYQTLLKRVEESDDLYIQRWTECSYDIKSHSKSQTVEVYEEYRFF